MGLPPWSTFERLTRSHYLLSSHSTISQFTTSTTAMSIDFWPQVPNQAKPSEGDQIASLVLFIIVILVTLPAGIWLGRFAITQLQEIFCTTYLPEVETEHPSHTRHGMSPTMPVFRQPGVRSTIDVDTINETWTIDLERQEGRLERVVGGGYLALGSSTMLRRSEESQERKGAQVSRHNSHPPTYSAVRAHKRHGSCPN